MSGTSRGQYGWFSPDIGGWFTDSLVHALESNQVRPQGNVEWAEVLQTTNPRLGDTYQVRRQ